VRAHLAEQCPKQAASASEKYFLSNRAAWKFSGFLGLTAITFVIGRFITVDPVLAVVDDWATQEVYDAARISMGLDRSVPEFPHKNVIAVHPVKDCQRQSRRFSR
jgi:hypothetical protein